MDIYYSWSIFCFIDFSNSNNIVKERSQKCMGKYEAGKKKYSTIINFCCSSYPFGVTLLWPPLGNLMDPNQGMSAGSGCHWMMTRGWWYSFNKRKVLILSQKLLEPGWTQERVLNWAPSRAQGTCLERGRKQGRLCPTGEAWQRGTNVPSLAH